MQTTAFSRPNLISSLTHGFVVKLNPAGSALSYSTYLTGSQGAFPQSLTLSSAGEVLVTGTTSSADFPITKDAYQSTIPPSALSILTAASRFICRFSAGGDRLVYSTFFGGVTNSNFSSIVVDGAGAAYITADMLGRFPSTPGAFAGPTSPDMYATTVYTIKLSADGGRLLYAVPLIAGTGTQPGASTVDANGNLWVAGRTSAPNFPITNDAYQSSYVGSACFGSFIGPFAGSGDLFSCGDVYLAELNPAGSSLVYSTYFGSNGEDNAAGLALAPDGSVLLAGTTSSALLPATLLAPQTHRAYGPDCTFEASPSSVGSSICTDSFLSRFGPAAVSPVSQFEVVNSASYLPGAVAPGELVTLFGEGIGPVQAYSSGSGAAGTLLGGRRVLFDATPAPLLYAGPSQINAIVPYDTALKQQVQVVIETNGVRGPARAVELASVSPGFTVVAPGVFSMDARGMGQAFAFNNEDGTTNSSLHPAPVGTVVGIYVTGLGVTDQKLPDGAITDPSLLPRNMGTVEVFVSGKQAQVLYAGAAPYLPAGVSQVNFVVPAGAGSGNQAVFVSAGHVEASQSGVWIAIR